MLFGLVAILGSMVAPRASKGVVYTVGFMAHMMLAAGFGLLHAAILHAIGISSVGQAAGWDLLGAIHGMVILVAMPMMLSMMHPLVRTRADRTARRGLGRVRWDDSARIAHGPHGLRGGDGWHLRGCGAVSRQR